jgi:hypothetical protein
VKGGESSLAMNAIGFIAGIDIDRADAIEGKLAPTGLSGVHIICVR